MSYGKMKNDFYISEKNVIIFASNFSFPVLKLIFWTWEDRMRNTRGSFYSIHEKEINILHV